MIRHEVPSVWNISCPPAATAAAAAASCTKSSRSNSGGRTLYCDYSGSNSDGC